MVKRKLLPDEKVLIPDELKQVMQIYSVAGFDIYLVGGGVRNILVGKIPKNCDLTTNATPEESLEVLKKFEPFYNNDFGTVAFVISVNGNEELYEITTYRSEKGYTDFRRPDSVTWGKTLEEDVFRRDFTVNAVVIGPVKDSNDYELIDMVDGLPDFEKEVIRAVGDPDLRFSEDALRMMRAIRFAATLGYQIEPKTMAAIATQSPLLEKISKERIREELMKIIGSNYPADGMRLLISTGLMRSVVPEVLEAVGVPQAGHHKLTVIDHMLESLTNCPASDPIVRLAAFLHDVGKPRSFRYRCLQCKKIFKRINENEEVACPFCGNTQPANAKITFYGHEVIGGRMMKEITERLKFNRKQIDKLTTLVRQHMFNYQPEMTDAAIRRIIRKVGKENIGDMIMLRIADRKGSGSKTTSWRLQELQRRIGEQLFEPMEINDMKVNGVDVMNTLDVKPGPIIGKVLKTLFDEVLEDTGKNNREYLLQQIKKVARENGTK